MNLDSIKEKIITILASDKRWPIVVDFPNRTEMADFIDYFCVGNNKFLPAEQFCGKDGTFKIEELVNTIENNSGNTFVTHLTAFLKIQGEFFTKYALKSLLSNNVDGHVVFISYQCKDPLQFSDPRFSERKQVIFADGESDEFPDVCLISPLLVGAFPSCYVGFEKLGMATEECMDKTVFLATDLKKDAFDKSILNLSQMTNGYDILCSRDYHTKTLPRSFGTPEQWNNALKMMGNGDWASIIESQFGPIYGLPDCLAQYTGYSDIKKWLYFIAVTLFGTKKNSYLQYAINNAANYKELTRSLFRAILTVDYSNPGFRKLYNERKFLLSSFTDSLDEIVDFCKVLSVKEKSSIYYLTDLTQPEKEKVIDWLDTYGAEYDTAGLVSILKDVYPDLADYLNNYRFKKELLDSYFDRYKYQKVINRILPSFEVIVDEQSRALGFVDVLDPRTSISDKLDLTNTHAYFFDALGVEYLGFIQAKCNSYGLSPNISCGRCELPSITPFNKEFVTAFEGKGCAVSDIKELDDIKHHGENSFDYEKVKQPLYLIRELQIIDDLLKKIRANIYAGDYDKAVIISDHGASRLAVLHSSENMWKMATNGVHSGRCCPKNEIDSKPTFAIEAEGFWVLTNYDRFQGGRKANVEVHGGASLEEVAVPIIEITRKRTNIEAFITDESKVVTLAAKEFPIIKIFVGLQSNNIAVRIGNRYYDANNTAEDYLYEVSLPDCIKKGVYSLDIMNGSDAVASNASFEVKKKGMSEVNLFD